MADEREPALWVYVTYLSALAVAYHEGVGAAVVGGTIGALVFAEIARWWRRRQH